MSSTFHISTEISFEAIKEFGFHHEYDNEHDKHFIISKRNPKYDYFYYQDGRCEEELNYLHPIMGPNDGFVGFVRYGSNDSEELIEYLTEVLGARVISDQSLDLSYFLNAVMDYYKLEEMADTVEFEDFDGLLFPMVDIIDFINVEYCDFEAMSDWVPRNSTMIESLLKECGISISPNKIENKEKNDN